MKLLAWTLILTIVIIILTTYVSKISITDTYVNYTNYTYSNDPVKFDPLAPTQPMGSPCPPEPVPY